jgi:2-keto-4-pentenoate hydratase/2-oxohepta-3-ene-1,7-dioic acid hydratase in catechol pathway
MKIARVGEKGFERPVLVIGEDAIFVDSITPDWNRESLGSGAFELVRSMDLSLLPREKFAIRRIGAPVARPTKIICVGMNYLKHISETNGETPKEPIVFMKAPDTLVGPYDDVIIPPGSTSTDYEVELAIVIGKQALYLKNPEDAQDYILGYSVSQDISERDWQLHRSGQWVKGKSFPTFNPMGPLIVTTDEINPKDLGLWCSIDDEMRQDSRTSDLLFGVYFIVWYISQFMELYPGDVINTGTPSGVGMGSNPPRYLRSGQRINSGIEGIGEITSRVCPHS